MNRFRKLAMALTVVGVCALAVPGMAQGRMPRMGGGGQQNGGGPRPDPTQRLTQELSLTAKQQNQIRPILGNLRKQLMSIRESKGTDDQKRQQMDHLAAAGTKSIDTILTAPQRKKFESMGGLRGMMMRGGGPNGRGPGGRMSMMFDHLNLTATQKKKLEPITSAMMKEFQALRGEEDRQKRRAAMQQIMAKYKPKIYAILNAQQKAEFDKMTAPRPPRNAETSQY